MTLTHLDALGRPRMVNVGHKPMSLRTAQAEGFILLQRETLEKIQTSQIQKGNVLTTAELAGVMAAKQTSHLIPLCHSLSISQVIVEATLKENGVYVLATAECIGQTGIEMEALTAVNVALLTIYDMCKAVDKTMQMQNIKLLKKTKTELKGA